MMWDGISRAPDPECTSDVRGTNTARERQKGTTAYPNTFDVQKALQEFHQALGTWRAVAAYLGGYSAGYWCAVARGRWRPSRRAENVLRRRLGLAPRGVVAVAQMRLSDLRWYLRNRCEMGAEEGRCDTRN